MRIVRTLPPDKLERTQSRRKTSRTRSIPCFGRLRAGRVKKESEEREGKHARDRDLFFFFSLSRVLSRSFGTRESERGDKLPSLSRDNTLEGAREVSQLIAKARGVSVSPETARIKERERERERERDRDRDVLCSRLIFFDLN